MPNRIIKESCRFSYSIDALSAEAERMFWRLTTVADDYGRFLADHSVLLSGCFPLKTDASKPGHLTTRHIQKWLAELTTIAAGDDVPLVTLYAVRGRAYGMFTKWAEHQRDRSKDKNPPKPKYPGPEQGEVLNSPQLAAVRVSTPQPAGELPAPAPEPTPVKAVVPDDGGEQRFAELWKCYPDRNGKKLFKSRTRILFLALSPEDQALCLRAVREYAKVCRDGRLPCDPPRWFKGQNGEVWREFVPTAPERPAYTPPTPTTPKGEPPPKEAVDILRKIMPNFGKSMGAA